MPIHPIANKMPKFYGSVTVGERGQISIPADARRDMAIEPSDKLLTFGGPEGHMLMVMKFESATAILADMATAMSEIQALMTSDSPPSQQPDGTADEDAQR